MIKYTNEQIISEALKAFRDMRLGKSKPIFKVVETDLDVSVYLLEEK